MIEAHGIVSVSTISPKAYTRTLQAEYSSPHHAPTPLRLTLLLAIAYRHPFGKIPLKVYFIARKVTLDVQF